MKHDWASAFPGREKGLLEKANRVEQLVTSTQEMFRVFLAEIDRTGRVPVNLSVAKNEEEAGDLWARRAAMLESFYDESKSV